MSLPLAWIPELPPGARLAIGRAPGDDAHTPLSTELAALHAAGIRHVLCLLEDDEFADLQQEVTPQGYAEAVDAAGMALHRVPVEDYTAPTRGTLAAMVRQVRGWLAQGEAVFVHCMAGRGRSGTVAAALLVAQGMRPEDAILLVRWARPGAVEAAEQEAALHALAALRHLRR